MAPSDVPSGGAPSTDDPSTDGSSAAGITWEEFTVILRVGEDGGTGRAVVGTDTGGIEAGGIRNIAQVIAVDAETGAIADFQQATREKDSDTGIPLTVRNLWAGRLYHFLVLMGHRERDYTAEAAVIPWLDTSPYIWKTGGDAPTLLAAGFLADQTIPAGGTTIAVTMKPLVVDTVFEYGGITAQASLAGAELPSGIGANLVWTITGDGLATLLDAQNKAGPQSGGINSGWGTLTLADKKTIVRFNPGPDVPTPAVLGGTEHNRIVLPLGAPDAGTSGSANFNLNYIPFGFGSMNDYMTIDPQASPWIIRNGVNDLAQNSNTTFTGSPKIGWNGTLNGNGAVRFTAAAASLDLSYLGPAPAVGQAPVTYFSTSRYNGTVAWAPNHSVFQPATVYNALVTLDPGAGYVFPSPENITGVHTAPGASVTVTHEYDLQLYVPLPVAGGTPVTSVETPTMNITIVWKSRGGTSQYYPDNGWGTVTPSSFVAGTLYGAAITLKAKGGHTFESHAMFQYPDFLNPDGADYADDVPLSSNLGSTVLLQAHEKTPIRGYYTFYWTSGSGPSSPNNTWTWQKSFAERKTLVSDKLRNTYNGNDLTEEEAKTERFVMVGFNDTQAAAPVSPGPAPGGSADGPRLAAVTFKRTGIPLYQDYAEAPFADVKAMLQTARDEGLNFMSITLKERHPGTTDAANGSTPLDPDRRLDNKFTTGNSPKEVVIDGGGRLLAAYRSIDNVLSVGDGVTLTLRNIILERVSDRANTVVKVEGGGHLILEDGVIIRGTVNAPSSGSPTTATGGGVYVAGTLTMRGGAISGNSSAVGNGVGAPTSLANGGGVYVAGGGTFIMEGGAVSGNTATVRSNSYGGGVAVAAGGVFEMRGGTISGNTVSSDYGTALGGGVYVAGPPSGGGLGGEFKKTGGTVLKNTALSGAGVYVADGDKQRNANAGPEVYLNSGEEFANWESWAGFTALRNYWVIDSPDQTPALTSSGDIHWYRFTAETGGTYALQWDDSSDGLGNFWGYGYMNIMVSAYRAGTSPIFEEKDKGYTAAPTFSLAAGETVTVKVETKSDPSYGYPAPAYYHSRYGIRWYRSQTQTWTRHIAAGETMFYDFTAIEPVTYFLQWDEAGTSSGAGYTGDIKVTVYSNTNYTNYVTDIDAGYDYLQRFDLAAGETVTVKVVGTTAGTYKVVIRN
jgi:hypothetical protein